MARNDVPSRGGGRLNLISNFFLPGGLACVCRLLPCTRAGGGW